MALHTWKVAFTRAFLKEKESAAFKQYHIMTPQGSPRS